MKHGLPGRHHLGVRSEWMTGIEVAVVVREIAAGYFDPDLVPDSKEIAGCTTVERVRVHLIGLNRLPLFQGIPGTGSQDTVAHVNSAPIRENINEFDRPIGVGS